MSFQLLESVAVIPDGNRRYAKKKTMPIEAAYTAGFRKSGEFSKWAFEAGVKNVSFWALSLDNFTKRSSNELAILFKLMGKNIRDTIAHKDFKDQNYKVKFFGKRELLPTTLQQDISEFEEKTVDRKNGTLNIAIAYSGRDELLNASKQLAMDIASGKIEPTKVDETMFSDYLYYDETPQLIIRTGNVQRLSGFLPWQNSYSELYFSPKLWPEFDQIDFKAAKEFFETTEQRFGK